MKFMVDARLPRRLALEITALGGDAIHTLDLPKANLTTDTEIIGLASRDASVVFTKDSDFVDSLLIHGQPDKLLFIATGNIPNDDLIRIVRSNWKQIDSMLQQGHYVELTRTALTLHF